MTCTLMATTEAPYDPANFWVAVVTAAGLYALTAFPLWDHIGEASREGREAPTWIFALAAAGTMLPIACVLMALDQLTKNPVPDPEHTSAVWTIPILLAASLVIRALTPLFLGRTTTPLTPPGPEGTTEATPRRLPRRQSRLPHPARLLAGEGGCHGPRGQRGSLRGPCCLGAEAEVSGGVHRLAHTPGKHIVLFMSQGA